LPDLREVLPTSNFNISRQCVCLFYAGSSRTPLASAVTSHSLPPARALAWRRSRSRSCGGCSRPSQPTHAVRVRRLLCAAGAAAAAVQWLSPLLLAACALHTLGFLTPKVEETPTRDRSRSLRGSRLYHSVFTIITRYDARLQPGERSDCVAHRRHNAAIRNAAAPC